MTSGTLILKFLNFILGLLPDVGFSNIPQVENVYEFLNIFAWVNFFVPTGIILSLLTITGSYYVFRSFYNIIKDFFF